MMAVMVVVMVALFLMAGPGGHMGMGNSAGPAHDATQYIEKAPDPVEAPRTLEQGNDMQGR